MESNSTMNANQLKALRLIQSGGKGWTDLARVTVSRHAPALLKMGLIEFAPKKKAAYSLTAKGLEAVNSKAT